MSRTVHLLGRPHLEGEPGDHTMRSRKCWALLAHLLLADRPPSRAELGAMLFDEADDPLGALRWSLSEVRRALAGSGTLQGDPVVLRLAPGTRVDVHVLVHGAWTEAVRLPGLGAGLLEGAPVRGSAAFASWLLPEQRRLAAATEHVLHEAAVAHLARGEHAVATAYAVRLLALAPLDEDSHALLIRLYRLAGDDEAALRQLATCTQLLRTELGTVPGPAVRAALRERRTGGDRTGDGAGNEAVDEASVEAALEVGRAAVSAGATETGADSLRHAVRLADRARVAGLPVEGLQVRTRLVLAETLVHAVRGQDEEGVAALQGAYDIAAARGDQAAVAQAQAELGYVDLLRARYDRAERRLARVLAVGGAPAVLARATAYLGVVHSDQARYASARALLERAAAGSRAAGDLRRTAVSLAMLGRLHLLRGELGPAGAHLRAALELATREHWLSYVPWPQALLGEVELARGDLPAAAALLEQAFARACRLGDPCWEGLSARGLALLADARGDPDRALALLEQAWRRATRLSDPYVWLTGQVLDARATVGRGAGHPGTAGWVDDLGRLAARTGMRELRVRALLHGAALGRPGDAGAARLLAAEVDNPRLAALLPPPVAGGLVPAPRSAPAVRQRG